MNVKLFNLNNSSQCYLFTKALECNVFHAICREFKTPFSFEKGAQVKRISFDNNHFRKIHCHTIRNKRRALVIVPLYAFTGNPLIFNCYLLTCEKYSSANFNSKLCSKHSILTLTFAFPFFALFAVQCCSLWPPTIKASIELEKCCMFCFASLCIALHCIAR